VVKLEDLTEGMSVMIQNNTPSDFLSRFRIIVLTKER
jgi:hypothetical protein